jgi:cysteine synthase A
MANFGEGGGGKFVVIIADGIQKYRRSIETIQETKQGPLEVPLQEAISNIRNYNRVLWIHTMYTPRKEGIELIANSLGVDESKISVPKASDVERLLATQKIPKELDNALGGGGGGEGDSGKSLLVCMMGNTSLRVAQVLAEKGIVAQSLTGGISTLSQEKGKPISELVQVATE